MRLLSSLVNRFMGSKASRPYARPKAFRSRPSVEHLEDRCVPSTITELGPLPADNPAPTGITAAADGSIWFTERSANQLGRLDGTGVLTEYAIPTAGSAPEQITASPKLLEKMLFARRINW